MERYENVHPTGNLDEVNKNPKPILITPSQQHHSRKSISGIDLLNGLKIITNTASSYDSSTPSSPVPSQLNSEHHFNNIEDFDIKEAIGIPYL